MTKSFFKSEMATRGQETQDRWRGRGNELFPATGRMTNRGKGDLSPDFYQPLTCQPICWALDISRFCCRNLYDDIERLGSGKTVNTVSLFRMN